MTKKLLTVLVLLIFVKECYAQSIRVAPLERTALDEMYGFPHVLQDQVPGNFILPRLLSGKPHFYDYTSPFSKKKSWILLVSQSSINELVYIDHNEDGDFTNDGMPEIFPLSDNHFTVRLTSQEDTNRFVQWHLMRKPEVKDSVKWSRLLKDVDTLGNISTKLLRFIKTINPDLYSSFDGTRGTFCFDDYMSLNRGKAIIADVEYDLGLFDQNFNGLYNDSLDIFMIDFNRDGLLDASETEMFKLFDIVHVGNKNYEISDVDRYGRSFVLQPTEKLSTNYYFQEMVKASQAYSEEKQRLSKAFASEVVIDSSLWGEQFQTLDHQSLQFSSLKGKYILMNFWGEWCKPCLGEIDELVHVRKSYPQDKLVMVSFLETGNIVQAQKIINEKQMDWHHVLLTNELKDKFRCNTFPTNVLISPDGKILERVSIIYRELFAKHIH